MHSTGNPQSGYITGKRWILRQGCLRLKVSGDEIFLPRKGLSKCLKNFIINTVVC